MVPAWVWVALVAAVTVGLMAAIKRKAAVEVAALPPSPQLEASPAPLRGKIRLPQRTALALEGALKQIAGGEQRLAECLMRGEDLIDAECVAAAERELALTLDRTRIALHDWAIPKLGVSGCRDEIIGLDLAMARYRERLAASVDVLTGRSAGIGAPVAPSAALERAIKRTARACV